jgi:hypothetical protein
MKYLAGELKVIVPVAAPTPLALYPMPLHILINPRPGIFFFK